MDLLAEVTNRVADLGAHPARTGFDAALRHIRVADRYFVRAKADRDDDLYNDVVYRSNQAFEGALKEAYAVLTKQDPAKLSPHRIEQYLIKNKLLSDRVLDQLTAYRTRWRNPSTHDHRLFLGQDDALLAVVNVAAFAVILLEQVNRQISAEREGAAIQKHAAKLKAKASKVAGTALPEQILELAQIFWAELGRENGSAEAPRGAELAGRLAGFIRVLNPELTVLDEPSVRIGANGPRILTDLLVRQESTEVPVEIKSSSRPQSAVDQGRIQMLGYLTEAHLSDGVLLVFPAKLSVQLAIQQYLIFTLEGIKRVHVLSEPFATQSGHSPDNAHEDGPA